MRKILLTSFLWVVAVLISVAAPVDEQSARQSAQVFISQLIPAQTRGGERPALTLAQSGIDAGGQSGIYVFNAPGAYVVVSADDEFPAVLAYGNGAAYDAAKAPAAMKAMLEAYSKMVLARAGTRSEVSTHEEILPMIETHWDQHAPFNLQCPVDDMTGERSVTGCVATAMAQVMYYHQWPASYSWSEMKTSYKSSDTGAAADAVAKLMADCGKAVFMEYSSSASSTSDRYACEALRYDFGYAETTDYFSRDCYTAAEWDELMYAELAAKRPILYSGHAAASGTTNGHSFILDGYKAVDGLGYYHVNWGWSGDSDDYFLISVLNSDQQYTGGIAGSSGYSFTQSAIIGIQPAEKAMEKTTRFFVFSTDIVDDKGTYSRSSASEDFPGITVEFDIYNAALPEKNRDYDVAIALYKGYELLKILDQAALKDIIKTGMNTNSVYGLSSDPLKLGKDLADGTYQLRVLSRESGKEDWAWAHEAACRFVELNISGNTMMTKVYGSENGQYAYVTTGFDFTVNKVTVGGSGKVGEPMTITVNLTSNNKTSNAPIFLWGNASIEAGENSYQMLSGAGTNLDPGETGDVVLEYTPQRGGSFNFILSGSVNDCSNPFYTFSAEAAGLFIDLQLTVDDCAPSAGMNLVKTNRLKGVARLTNYGSEVFDDRAVVLIAGAPSLDEQLQIADREEVSLKIGLLESQDIPFNFENLTPGYYYALLVAIRYNDDTKYLNMADGRISYAYIYHISEEASGIAALKADAPDADVYNLQGVRIGKASELQSLPKGVYIINRKKVLNR